MASIARGLETGINLGFKIDEALRQKRMRDEIEAAQREKEFQKYTPEQGLRMREEAAMTDEYGRPLYQYTIEPGSTTYQRRAITYGEPPVSGDYTPDFSRYGVDEGRSPMSTMYRIPSGDMMEQFSTDSDGVVNYAPSTGRGLSATEANYTPTLQRSLRPEETELYRQLTTQYGEPTSMAPTTTEYLGKTYTGGLSQQQKDSALMARYADIISRENPMEGLKFRIMAQQEGRAAQEFDVKQKLNNLQLKAAERGEKFSQAEDALIEDIKKDPSLLQGDLTKLFTSRGVPLERGNKLVEAYNGLDSGTITRMQNVVKKKFLASKGNLGTFLQSTLDDDDYDPNSHMVQRRGPNGGIIIDTVETVRSGRDGAIKQNGRVLSSTQELPTEAEAMDFIYNTLTNPGVAAQTALKNQELRSKIEENTANADFRRMYGNALSSGGLRRGTADRTEQDVVARLRENRETIKDIDAELEKLGSRKDKLSMERRDYLTTQRNELDAENRQLRGYSRFDGGAGGGQPSYKAGDVVSYLDESGKPVRAKFKGGENKKENWEVLSDTTANPLAEPKKGLEKPSGKGMTEKQYEDWVDEKLIGTFTSRVQQLQSIIKDNPNPQIKAAAQRLLDKEKTRAPSPGVDMPL